MSETQIYLDPSSIESYRLFKAVKRLPQWRIRGRVASFPSEYASRLGITIAKPQSVNWTPTPAIFDYSQAIAAHAIRKRKFCIFADCGLGKTPMLLEFAQAARANMHRGFLIVSPLMVIKQTIEEARRWYPSLEIEHVRAADLNAWLTSCNGKLGITNYDAITDDLTAGQLGGIALDESSMLKSHYGKWATKLLELGKGLEWKLCCTGTPAPNDRIEYANHAVFMDAYPTVNSFLATFFVNRGQTQERWVLRDHAVGAFYRALSHWSIFLTNPATYGWRDNCECVPPIISHIEHVDLTDEQARIVQQHTGHLFAASAGGIVSRSTLGQLAKGRYKGESVQTLKPDYIRNRINDWPTESTIIWCLYNAEQDQLAGLVPDSVSISGATPYEARMEMLDAFKAKRVRTLISKPKVLGFGLNLQVATRHVFSGLQDSYESYYQAIKRSNRYGSTEPLNVHIPVTDLEYPMVENVLRKAHMVQRDTEVQERLFSEYWKEQCG